MANDKLKDDIKSALLNNGHSMSREIELAIDEFCKRLSGETSSNQQIKIAKKPKATNAAVTIARLHATLSELCKIDLTHKMADDDEAIRTARNLASTVERLRKRGIKEIPEFAIIPVRQANRIVRARKNQRKTQRNP